MSNQYPYRNRMSMREGHLYIDGKKVLDVVKASIKFKPELMQTRSVGQKGKCTRYVGYTIEGNIERYKATSWTRDIIKKYMNTGATQHFVLQGIAEDKNSDYYREVGIDKVTITDVVFTGDISVLELDAGDTAGAKDTLAFTAYDIMF